MSKQQQSYDWGAPELSDAQKDYAASDVRYMHLLRAELDRRLAREGRTQLAQACFDFLPHRRRSEEHTSELQSLMRISYAVFCLKKKNDSKTQDSKDNRYKYNYVIY